MNQNSFEFLYITSIVSRKKCILKKLSSLSSGLYCAKINAPEVHLVNQKFTNDPNTFKIWHDRLGHPRSIMMRKIIENLHSRLF